MVDEVRLLSQASATTCAHQLAAWIGREHGIRVLSIKGFVADFHELRAPRPAADADVLIEPDRFHEFCLALETRGWHTRVGRATPSLLQPHSRTYINDSWPCDIDVHEMFPGFHADPSDAFKALWATRSCIQTGGQALSVPSRAGSAVIGLLHGMRSPQSARHQHEIASIEALLDSTFFSLEREELYWIVGEGGAMATLHHTVRRAGLDAATQDATKEQWDLWEKARRFDGEGSTAAWVFELRRTPLRLRLCLLIRAIWVPRRNIPRNSAQLVPTWSEAWAYQLSRWKRGLRALARYARKRQ